MDAMAQADWTALARVVQSQLQQQLQLFTAKIHSQEQEIQSLRQQVRQLEAKLHGSTSSSTPSSMGSLQLHAVAPSKSSLQLAAPSVPHASPSAPIPPATATGATPSVAAPFAPEPERAALSVSQSPSQQLLEMMQDEEEPKHEAKREFAPPQPPSTAAITAEEVPGAVTPVAASARRKRPASPSTLAEEEDKRKARVTEPAATAAGGVATNARPAPSAASLARLPSFAAMQMETQSIDPLGFAAGGSAHTAAASSHTAKAAPAAAIVVPAPAPVAAASARSVRPVATVSLTKTEQRKMEQLQHQQLQAAGDVVDLSGESQDPAGGGATPAPASSSSALALALPQATPSILQPPSFAPPSLLGGSSKPAAAVQQQPSPPPLPLPLPQAPAPDAMDDDDFDAEQEFGGEPSRVYGAIDAAGDEEIPPSVAAAAQAAVKAEALESQRQSSLARVPSERKEAPTAGRDSPSPAPIALPPSLPPVTVTVTRAPTPPQPPAQPSPPPPPAATAVVTKPSALALVSSAFPANANAMALAAANAASPSLPGSTLLPNSQAPLSAEVRAAAEADAAAGISLAARSDWPGAASKLSAAIDALAGHDWRSVPVAWFKQRSTVYAKLGRNALAFEDAHRMVAHHPREWLGYYVLSTLLGRDKNYSAALVECRQAWRRVPKRDATRARVAAASGDTAAAVAAARVEKEAESDRQKVAERVHQLEQKLHLAHSVLNFDQTVDETLDDADAASPAAVAPPGADEMVASVEVPAAMAAATGRTLSPPLQQQRAQQPNGSGGSDGKSILRTPQQAPRPSSTHLHPPTVPDSGRTATTAPVSPAGTSGAAAASAHTHAHAAPRKALDFAAAAAGGDAVTTQLPVSPSKGVVAGPPGPITPLLSFGTYKLSGSQCTDSVVSALRLGFRRVDTGASYNNEEAVGRALAASGLPRSAVFVATKLSWADLTTSEHAYAAGLACLKRLGLAHVDQMLLHHPGRAKLPRDSPLHASSRLAAWRGLERLQAEGRVRRIGVSNFEQKHLVQLLASGNARVRPAVNQIEMHPLLFDTQRALASYCAANSITVEAYMPLGGGKRDLLSHPLLGSMARSLARSPAEVLLRWSAQHGFVPVVKAASPAHQKQNIGVAAESPPFTLSDEQMRTLDQLGQGADAKRFAWDPRGYA